MLLKRFFLCSIERGSGLIGSIGVSLLEVVFYVYDFLGLALLDVMVFHVRLKLSGIWCSR